VAVRVQTCPSCGTELPDAAGFSPWCAQCGWNLKAPDVRPPRTRLDRLYARAGRRAGERMLERLLEADELEPRLTPARAAAYALAGGIHLLTTALVGGGIALGALTFPNPFTIALALVMVAVGLFMRPRAAKPPDEDVVDLARVPTLAAVADEVARALSVRGPDILVVDESFNASWSVVGLRRRRVLTLGLPLFAALSPRERVALIAHELAHERNGDVTRGLFVGSAINALAELLSFIAPEHVGEGAGLTEHAASLVFWIVSRPVYWLLLLQVHLVLADAQRAEYLADALAASVAGSDAVVALHESTLLTERAEWVLRTVADRADGDLFVELARELAAVPEYERERRRRVARLAEARLSDTHPPTAMRIRLLEEHGVRTAVVELDDARSAAIDDELRFLQRALVRKAHDAYRDRLYY
jgi:Zn-dependent protease with chaperone function